MEKGRLTNDREIVIFPSQHKKRDPNENLENEFICRLCNSIAIEPLMCKICN